MSRTKAEFVVETLPGEVLVYDLSNHRAHCLTEAAATVWAMCDGRRADEARKALVAIGAQDSLESVLGQLTDAGLVRTSVERIDQRRRRMIRKTAVAAGIVLASPAVFSIWSPAVAGGASVCGGNNQVCCTQGNPCPTCTLTNCGCNGVQCVKGG